jgi:hypothetical protein
VLPGVERGHTPSAGQSVLDSTGASECPKTCSVCVRTWKNKNGGRGKETHGREQLVVSVEVDGPDQDTGHCPIQHILELRRQRCCVLVPDPLVAVDERHRLRCRVVHWVQATTLDHVLDLAVREETFGVGARPFNARSTHRAATSLAGRVSECERAAIEANAEVDLVHPYAGLEQHVHGGVHLWDGGVREDAGVELDVPTAVDVLGRQSVCGITVSRDLVAYVGHEIDPVRVVLEVLDRELLQVPAQWRLSGNGETGKVSWQTSMRPGQ